MVAGGAYAALPGGIAFAANAAAGRALPVPTAAQRRWADMELGMFFHFDIPVFKPNWNWRSFKDFPDPKLYNPAKLDTDQWMEAAKAYGAKYVVLVAKHCSGFLQWQSDLYPPGLYASVSGNGFLGADNLGRVFVKGCWLGDPSPESKKRYAKICERMTEELWSRYGELFEIWFDGGALAPEKGGPDLLPLIEKYQPNALLFQGPPEAKNLIRWVGNERGVAPYPCWATGIDGTADDGTKEMQYNGNPDGGRWIPGECDVPLGRNRWFCYNRGPNWTMDYLMNMYDCSVGRNCNLLLNAAPQPDGLILESEMKTYAEFGRRIKGRYANRLAAAEGEGDRLELAIPKDSGPVNQVILAERIEQGERIRKFVEETLFWHVRRAQAHRPLREGRRLAPATLRRGLRREAAHPRFLRILQLKLVSRPFPGISVSRASSTAERVVGCFLT